MTDMDKKLRITLVRSLAGRTRKQHACIRGLGLRRLHHTVLIADTPENRGMAYRVGDMLQIEEA